MIESVEFVNSGNKKERIEPYVSTSAYLSDELYRLNILIRMALSGDNVDAGYMLNRDRLLTALENRGNKNIKDEELGEEYAAVSLSINNRLKLTAGEGTLIPFLHITECFNLNRIEKDILLICLADGIDPIYGELYAFIQGNSMLKYPTRWLIYLLLSREFDSPGNLNEYLSPARNLVYWRLLNFEENSDPRVSGDLLIPVRIDTGIRDYLSGASFTGQFSLYFGELVSAGPDVDDLMVSDALKSRVAKVINNSQNENPPRLFQFSGPGIRNKLGVAFTLSSHRGSVLLYVDIKNVFRASGSLHDGFKKLIREVRLFNLDLFLDNGDFLEKEQNRIYKVSLLEYLRMAGVTCYLSVDDYIRFNAGGLQEPFVHLHFDYPDYKMRYRIWEKYSAGEHALIKRLSSNFILTEDEILQAVTLADRQGAMEESQEEQIFAACRAQRNHNLKNLADKIEYPFSFEDIVLPEDAISLLKETIFFYKSKDTLFNDWGFKRKMPYGQGVTVLFSGPSGTGKTMAASIIANNLGLDMYRVDLATVVSKYIGETEKNLKRIFNEARASNVILFFDEADAVFGKRTDVKDAHDRYANIETSYLLQMMEEYDGMTVLATNYRENIDEAFTRRIRFIVEFPFPDKEYRESIWRISFPEAAPVEAELDYSFLARKVQMAGGNIKSIALMAAMFAIRNKESISMKHIVRGIRREYQRHGKSFIKSDFMPYYQLLEKDGEL